MFYLSHIAPKFHLISSRDNGFGSMKSTNMEETKITIYADMNKKYSNVICTKILTWCYPKERNLSRE